MKLVTEMLVTVATGILGLVFMMLLWIISIMLTVTPPVPEIVWKAITSIIGAV